MPKKKKEVEEVSVPLEEKEFKGVPLEELKDHPELHEAYESLYGIQKLNALLKEE